MITSLNGVAADDILALYRLRWQIELAFKRLKSLAGLDRVPARGAPLARAWIAAKLIIATLIGLTIEEFMDAPAVGAAIATRPPSIWCVFSLALQQIIHLVWRVDPHPNFGARRPRTAAPPLRFATQTTKTAYGGWVGALGRLRRHYWL